MASRPLLSWGWTALQLSAALITTAGAQRLKEYNLWVCPHCEGGVKSADVTDLGCEAGNGVADWTWVKEALYRFVDSLRQGPETRSMDYVKPLLELAAAPLQGECYLGIVSLGFFSYHFMEHDEREDFIRTSIFGSVTFQRAVPISYWDVYSSGWPLFGLLAAAGEIVRADLAAAKAKGLPTKQPDLGYTGIDLSPRHCDHEGTELSEEDKRFLFVVSKNLASSKDDWVGEPLSLIWSLTYLGQSAKERSSWGKATAYLALAEVQFSETVQGDHCRKAVTQPVFDEFKSQFHRPQQAQAKAMLHTSLQPCAQGRDAARLQGCAVEEVRVFGKTEDAQSSKAAVQVPTLALHTYSWTPSSLDLSPNLIQGSNSTQVFASLQLPEEPKSRLLGLRLALEQMGTRTSLKCPSLPDVSPAAGPNSQCANVAESADPEGSEPEPACTMIDMFLWACSAVIWSLCIPLVYTEDVLLMAV